MSLPKEFELKRFVRNGVDYEFLFYCDNSYLLSVFRKADRLKEKSLDFCFGRLNIIAENYGCCSVKIFKDFAEASFLFNIVQYEQEEKSVLHGGIIFHAHTQTWGLHT